MKSSVAANSARAELVRDESLLMRRGGAADRVSPNGGRLPRWRRDGRELVLQDPDGSILAVDLAPQGPLRPGAPKLFFTLPVGTAWSMTADAQRFLVPLPSAEAGLTPITVILNRPAGTPR